MSFKEYLREAIAKKKIFSKAEQDLIKRYRPKPININKHFSEWNWTNPLNYDISYEVNLSKEEYKKKKGYDVYMTTANEITHNDMKDDPYPHTDDKREKISKPFQKEDLKELKRFLTSLKLGKS